jgi:enamine deaminase RidA (YjgF/YER057c/UK114 family)
MPAVKRMKTSRRMSQIVQHGNTVYLAGQVGKNGATIAEQTRQALDAVDALLTEAGTDRKHILQAVIWLAKIEDFAQMNHIWDNWIPKGHAPSRACGEAKLAEPDLFVEVIVTAAIPNDEKTF